MAIMSGELFDALARAIEHAANVDGATASPLMNEEARNLAGAALTVTEQVCATLAEDLRKTRDERDRLLPFVIQKCSNCGLVTHPVIEPVAPRPSIKHKPSLAVPHQCSEGCVEVEDGVLVPESIRWAIERETGKRHGSCRCTVPCPTEPCERIGW